MIKVTFESKNGSVVKGEISGHALFSDSDDIVCASVSSVAFAMLNGIENVIGLSFGYEVKDGFLLFVLPDDIDSETRKKVDILLDSFYLYLIELEKQYKHNIKVVKTEV